MTHTDYLLSLIRENKPMTFRQQITLMTNLCIPALIAQSSIVIMQYIDASMVGQLGANSAASISLVITTDSLMVSLCAALSMGISVLISHEMGSNNMKGVRQVFRESLSIGLIFGIFLAMIGISISKSLPHWLGGDDSICSDASMYFFTLSLFLPVTQMRFIASGVLKGIGNVRIPSILNILACPLDVIFNFLLIFESGQYSLLGFNFHVYGAGLGVGGAALGTVMAEAVVMAIMLWYACVKSPVLRLSIDKGPFIPRLHTVKRTLKISIPMGIEYFAVSAAMMLTTIIVAPLGTKAIAANGFAIAAESVCYFPGYGISEAATTLSGQCYGAKRKDLLKRFANISVISGMIIMCIIGTFMYLYSDKILGFMTVDKEICNIGAEMLRIVAIAEPFSAAALVAYGIFVGIGKTFVPCVMNLSSIWCVRLILAILLVPSMGLTGVWVAIAVELCFRGLIFLTRLYRSFF